MYTIVGFTLYLLHHPVFLDRWKLVFWMDQYAFQSLVRSAVGKISPR